MSPFSNKSFLYNDLKTLQILYILKFGRFAICSLWSLVSIKFIRSALLWNTVKKFINLKTVV